MGREPKLSIVTGRKGTGKTVQTAKLLRKYVVGDPANGVPGRKVIVFDTNNEYSDKTLYPDIKALALSDVERFSLHPEISIRRVTPFLPTGEEMTPDQKQRAVLWILRHFRNGLVLLEDTNSYIGDYVPGDAVGIILSQRHKGIDIILHYHSFGRVQKKIWPHINLIRMHKTNDSVMTNIQKFPDKFECFKIAENIVDEQYNRGNIYFYLYIDNDYEKIHAEVERADIDKAVDTYLRANMSTTIGPLLNMRDDNNGKMFTQKTAIEQEKKRLIAQYFEVE